MRISDWSSDVCSSDLAYAKRRTCSSLAQLLKLQPRSATLVVAREDDVLYEGETEMQEISVDLVQRGDVLQVVPGARIPVDGRVVFGTTFVDEAMITGEPVTVPKQVGEIVFGGTVKQPGLIR